MRLTRHAARDRIIAVVPPRRIGATGDVAQVLFPAPDTAVCITGACLPVDGGRPAT